MVGAAQQLTEFQARIQEVKARLDKTTKDLSLLTMVPKWPGIEKSGSFQEFLSAVYNMAEMGNCSDKEKVRIATIKSVGRGSY
jgi:chitinase